jgi:hypothetical protein
MSRRPRWWHQLQASKQEVLLAVDLYNRSGSERQLQAFVVHMCMGWLKLLQSGWERDGQDFYIRGQGRRRKRTREGDFVTKSLLDMVAVEFQESDPRRKNLEFFIGLRNRIEHRFDRNIAALVAGKTQALVLNYESSLTGMFGASEGLASELRFPVFVSTVTQDAVEALKRIRRKIPKAVLDYVQDFDAALDPEVSSDQAYEFRVQLIPVTSAKTEADVAMSFVRLEDLDEELRRKVREAQTIIREKQVPVADLGTLLPGQVTQRVADALGLHFSVNDHTACWKHFEVRPMWGSDHPERTKAEFCRYNQAFGQWVYTEAWVSFLVRKLRDSQTHRDVLKREPAS